MDWIRRGARSPQGLKPAREQMFMSELEIRHTREEERERTGLKTGHYKTANLQRSASEGGPYKGKNKQTQDGGVNRPLQRPTEEKTRTPKEQGCGARPTRRPLRKRKSLTPEGVSYRTAGMKASATLKKVVIAVALTA